MILNPSILINRLPSALQAHLRYHAARRSFTWNVFVMVFGTAFGQAISLILAPVLTRIFSPAQFGHLSVYGSLLMIAGGIASAGLELAIPICISDLECASLFALSAATLLLTTSAVAVAAWLIPVETLSHFTLESLATYRWLFPLGFACLGSYSLMVAIATRAHSYTEIARTRVSQGLTGPVSQIILGLLGAGTPGLIIGFVIGQSSGTFLLFSRILLKNREWFRSISLRGMASAAWRYRRFPLFTSWSRLLEPAGAGLVLYALFSTLYSPSVAGFMFLSDRVVARPLAIVSTSLLQVFTGEAGRSVSVNPKHVRRRFYQVVSRQCLLAIAWIAAANIVAGWVFPRLFGPEWAEAIPYLRAVSISFFVIIVLHPVSTTLQMLEHQATAAIWQVCRLGLVVVAVVVSWRLGEHAITALWITSAVQAFCGIVLLGLMIASIERLVAQRA
ncbi:MAG: oligosaccharide flippase family protein [Acetobacteraceae bacterium]|nr:oligosaccharide flippase family protein [Acetobacteraceae bacterium]